MHRWVGRAAPWLLGAVVVSCRAAASEGDLLARVKEDSFGATAEGHPVRRFTIQNPDGTRAQLIDYGATLTQLWVPDRDGVLEDVVLGFDHVRQYETESPYFGCTTGRVANRIARGRFHLDGVDYQLATNNDPHHLHGGVRGLDNVMWDAEAVVTDRGPGVRFSYTSPDGEEGYPGDLHVVVTYVFTRRHELWIDYRATADRATPVNLTHHSYFHLGGPASGSILGHELQISAQRYTEADATLVPTGRLVAVDDTPFDFREPRLIGERIAEVEGGYDLNYVIDGWDGRSLRPAAVVYEPHSGRRMAIETTEPGLQLYSGNFLDGSLTGKGGVVYRKHGGFCLETQHFPDSVNQPSFPSTILRPGETYRHVVVHRFSAR